MICPGLNGLYSGPAKNEEEAASKSYQFWSTQPVPSIDEVVTSNESISPDVAAEEVRQEGYSLPPGFQWDTLQLDDPLVLKELYILLNENYVEDDDNMFRFDYSPEFLAWALKPPGKFRNSHFDSPEMMCCFRISQRLALRGES